MKIPIKILTNFSDILRWKQNNPVKPKIEAKNLPKGEILLSREDLMED
jgi:hypothetical protein